MLGTEMRFICTNGCGGAGPFETERCQLIQCIPSLSIPGLIPGLILVPSEVAAVALTA